MRKLRRRGLDSRRQRTGSQLRFLATAVCGLALAGCSHAADPDGLPRTWRDDSTESVYVELDDGGTGRVVGFPSVATHDDCERRIATAVTEPISWEVTSRGVLHLSGEGIDATAVAGERFGVVWSELTVDLCGAFEGISWNESFYETASIPLGTPSE
jgi:hypothetical protein